MSSNMTIKTQNGYQGEQTMDRLTKEYYYTNDPKTWLQKANNKLGKLEDIMQKYGIESVEELEDRAKTLSNIAKIKQLDEECRCTRITFSALEEIEKIQHDRDTWKRACELACEELEYCFNDCSKCRVHEYCSKSDRNRCKEVLADYFYTQAQKERKDAD